MRAAGTIRITFALLLLLCLCASAFAQAAVSIMQFDLAQGTRMFPGEKARFEVALSNDSNGAAENFGLRLEASDNLYFSEGFERRKIWFAEQSLAPLENKRILVTVSVDELASPDSNVSVSAFRGADGSVPLASFVFPLEKSPLDLRASVDASSVYSGNDARITVSAKNVSREILYGVSAKAILQSGLFSAKPDAFLGALSAGEEKKFFIYFNAEPEFKGSMRVLLDADFVFKGQKRSVELSLNASSSGFFAVPSFNFDFNVTVFLVIAVIFIFFAFQKVVDPKWFNPGLAAKMDEAKKKKNVPHAHGPVEEGEKLNRFRR